MDRTIFSLNQFLPHNPSLAFSLFLFLRIVQRKIVQHTVHQEIRPSIFLFLPSSWDANSRVGLIRSGSSNACFSFIAFFPMTGQSMVISNSLSLIQQGKKFTRFEITVFIVQTTIGNYGRTKVINQECIKQIHLRLLLASPAYQSFVIALQLFPRNQSTL